MKEQRFINPDVYGVGEFHHVVFLGCGFIGYNFNVKTMSLISS